MPWRRIALITAASLLMGAALASAGSIEAATTVSGHGISVRLPPSWTGVVYRRVGGLPILHAGSFRLPPIDGDDGALRAVRRMRPRDVLLVMLEYRPSQTHFPNRALPLRLRRSEFGAPVEGMPWSHAFARIEFATGRRSFDLWIEFGSKHASPAAIRAVDRVLASLRVRAR